MTNTARFRTTYTKVISTDWLRTLRRTKVKEAYHKAVNFRPELEPVFYSDVSDFRVTLFNLNYNVPIAPKNVAIEVAIDGLTASKGAIEKAKAVYTQMASTVCLASLM